MSKYNTLRKHELADTLQNQPELEHLERKKLEEVVDGVFSFLRSELKHPTKPAVMFNHFCTFEIMPERIHCLPYKKYQNIKGDTLNNFLKIAKEYDHVRNR